jgi:hypothetical protein
MAGALDAGFECMPGLRWGTVRLGKATVDAAEGPWPGHMRAKAVTATAP